MESESTINQNSPAARLDVVSLARVTRKTLDRLAPFAFLHLPPESQSSNAIVNKILSRINSYITSIDQSMLSMQMAYHLSNESLVLCDLGLDGPRTGRKTTSAASAPTDDDDDEGWEVDVTVESLQEQARRGVELIQKIRDVFRDVSQDVYKIAALTKESNIIVQVPREPGSPETLTMTLKDIGHDIVANLSLLSEFSRGVVKSEEWWTWVLQDLELEHPTCLFPQPAPTKTPETSDVYAAASENANTQRWMEAREQLQEYYNIIHPLQERFPTLLRPSAEAWKTVAIAMARAPSPTNSDVGSQVDQTTPTPKASSEALTKRGDGRRVWDFFGRGADRRYIDLEKNEGKAAGPRWSTSQLFSRSGKVKEVAEKPKASLSCCAADVFDDGP